MQKGLHHTYLLKNPTAALNSDCKYITRLVIYLQSEFRAAVEFFNKYDAILSAVSLSLHFNASSHLQKPSGINTNKKRN